MGGWGFVLICSLFFIPLRFKWSGPSCEHKVTHHFIYLAMLGAAPRCTNMSEKE